MIFWYSLLIIKSVIIAGRKSFAFITIRLTRRRRIIDTMQSSRVERVYKLHA